MREVIEPSCSLLYHPPGIAIRVIKALKRGVEYVSSAGKTRRCFRVNVR